MNNPTTIKEWAKACYQCADDKGWHEDYLDSTDAEVIAAKGINIHAEISELWEAARNDTLGSYCDKHEKMKEAGCGPLTCVEEELADIIIRTLDLAELLGVDIQYAIEQKHKFNLTRSHKHGGKLA